MQPERRSIVERIVGTLLDKGLVKDHLPEPDEPLSDVVLRRFAPQLELLDHLADRPRWRFRRFRESRVLLVGGGESFRALARGLLHNGLGRLALCPRPA